MDIDLEARDALIQSWLDSKLALASAKEIESDQRAALTEMLFPTPVKGTQRYALSAGYAVKLVQNYTYDLGNKDAISDGLKVSIESQVLELEKAITALGVEAVAFMERLIRWKPELSGSEYEKLDVTFQVQQQVKALIDTILTIKPGSPQLTFEEPKAAKG